MDRIDGLAGYPAFLIYNMCVVWFCWLRVDMLYFPFFLFGLLHVQKACPFLHNNLLYNNDKTSWT